MIKSGFCLMLLPALFFVSRVEAKTIRLGFDDFCPYSCVEGDFRGFFVEAVQEALKHRDIEIDRVTGSWARLQLMIAKNQLDLVVPVTGFEIEELKIERNSFPLANLKAQYFVQKRSRWNYAGPDSLKGQSMALIREYWYPAEILAYANNPLIKNSIFFLASEKGTDQQVKMLAAGRVSLVASDLNVFLYHAKKNGMEARIRAAGGDLLERKFSDLYIGAARSKEASEVLKALNEGLERMNRTGELDRIRSRYDLK